MALKDDLERNEIDLAALKRIRQRVFVVGRFNQKNRSDYPDLYLFTNRPIDPKSKYSKNFTNVKNMQYESFVKELRPAISEKFTRRGRINYVTQVIPQEGDASEGTSVIDIYNFFFLRATANSPQEHYQDSAPGLPAELLRESKGDRGRQIFQLIRRNVAIFSSFQSRTHELVDAISKLLSFCGRRKVGSIILPDYADGDALPTGFPERLIDYLYAEDARERFSADGLELTGPWQELDRDQNAKALFCSVVTSFRDSLLGNVPQHGRIRFEGKNLDAHAVDHIPPELKTSFQASRDAFNGLRQMLRSKVLLSMVLEWLLLEGYDRIEATEGVKGERQRDEAIETAILTEHEKNGLAKPVERASKEERESFSKTLSDNYEHLIDAVLATDAEATGKLDALPPAIRKLASDMRLDPAKKSLLAGVTGHQFGPEYRKAFVDATKMVLVDVLCPALFQEPILTVGGLRRYFRQETMRAYMWAVFMATDGEDAVRKIAEDNIEFFQQRIDKATQTITNPTEIHSRLIGEFMQVLANPEIERRLTEGLRVLKEGQAVLQSGSVESIARMVPIRPDPKLHRNETLESTDIKKEEIVKPLQAVVEARVAERISESKRRTATAASSAGTGGAPPAASTSSYSSSGPSTAAAQSEESDDDLASVLSSFEQTANTAVDDLLLNAYPGTEPADLKKAQVADVVDKATKGLVQKEGFIDGVKGDVRAFEQALFLIYQRYNEQVGQKKFRNGVERLTLINMMLLYQKELGLGLVSSNLHHLLLDMIEHLDPENPDLKAFMKERSLTLYFDNPTIKDRGITNLRQTLRSQADDSLAATVNFVSELRGIQYLMDHLSTDPEAEVVVVNATADQFMNWLRADNISDNNPGELDEKKQPLGRLRSGQLVKRDSDAVIAPGLVYLTDIAFASAGDKVTFIENLADCALQNEGHRFVLPPICISTGPFEDSARLRQEGTDFAEAAKESPAPVLVVGPSPLLTQLGDPFRTYLPAGYMFAAHFLKKPNQAITIRNVAVRSQGRFRVVGGNARMRDALEAIVRGEDRTDTYAFAVDFYLYIVLTVLATIQSRRGAANQGFSPNDFFVKLFSGGEGGWNRDQHKESAILDGALLLPATSFSLYTEASQSDGEEPPSSGRLQSTEVTEGKSAAGVTFTQDGHDRKPLELNITDIGWFNRARKAAGLS